MVDRWSHSRRCSTLWRGDDLTGVVWPAPGWAAYSDLTGRPLWGLLGYFPTRADATARMAAACDPKKGGR